MGTASEPTYRREDNVEEAVHEGDETRRNFHERSLGKSVAILLPSLKLKQPARALHLSLEAQLHDFLMSPFGGYTAQAGNILGYWRDANGSDSYCEHREFTVAINEERKLTVLKEYVAHLSHELSEKCIYLRSGKQTVLVYPGESQPPDQG